MKSYVLIGLLLILSFAILSSQPNVPRFENPQIEFKYTVVIGSMQKLENAEKLQRLAIENGYESFIAPVNIRNKQHYRVCVGLLQDFSQSKKQLNIIKKDLNIGNAWIWQAPQVTEMVKPETKKIEQQKQEVTKTSPTSPKEPIQKPETKKIEQQKQEVTKTLPTTPKDPIQKPEMKKIEPPSTPTPEITRPDTKSNHDVVQSTPPKNDIPVTTPTEPKKPETPKVAEQPKAEPKPEPTKVAEQPKNEPKPEPTKVAEQPKNEPKPEPTKVAEQPKAEPKPETPKVAEQPKAEPKPEPKKVVEQPKTEPKPEPTKVAEQPKTEPKPEPTKVAEQPKTEPKAETPKVAEQPKNPTKKLNKQNQDKNIAQQKQETTNEPKQTEQQVSKELTPPVFISDTILVDLAKTLPQLLTTIRNYEYLQANKYIHPDLHFYVIYNEESKPSVREFNSFEKFFGVFSAFTGKGTSFDFSNDIEQMLKKNPVTKPYPIYDCNTHKYNQKGLIASTAGANNINLLNSVRVYYRSFNQELLPEISEKVGKVESRIQAAVIDTESSFIEGMYFGYIDGKWYLLVLDIKFRCR